jgi:hypothetical protein
MFQGGMNLIRSVTHLRTPDVPIRTKLLSAATATAVSSEKHPVWYRSPRIVRGEYWIIGLIGLQARSGLLVSKKGRSKNLASNELHSLSDLELELEFLPFKLKSENAALFL